MRYIAVVVLSLLCYLGNLSAYALDVKTYIPKQAPQYFPLLKAEQDKFFAELPFRNYMAGLVEQESCISLTHSKCWNPASKLQTSREIGVGLGQLTKAFRQDGSVRFDSLTDMKKSHKEELKEISWENIVQRPDLQIRAMVLMIRDNYRSYYKVSAETERLNFSDASYNSGRGNIDRDRRECGLRKGCDPQYWFENVELTCTMSHKPIYGTRSACDINRHHVSTIRKIRMPKYAPFFPDKPTTGVKHAST